MAFDGNDRKVMENFRAGMRLYDVAQNQVRFDEFGNMLTAIPVPEPNREDQMRALTSAYMADRLDSYEYVERMDALP